MNKMPGSLLAQINDPANLRKLSREQLVEVAGELRQYLLDSVSQTGGHLSSNLGTVELTVALHSVFNTPEDRLVWDVGHQTYPHKILTGRRDRMSTLRQFNGLAGFPKRSESPYDTFGVGHSSTSISAALGMALAAKQKGEQRQVVAIIGDGAMSAGQAFEALNNAGVANANLLVILNDNEMSISPPVGALYNYLTRLTSGKLYNAAKKGAEKVLGVSQSLLDFAKRAEEHVKGMINPGTLFEEFGFHYYGPIDGHDLDALIPTLQNLKQLPGPRFLHIVTHKGQGYKLAEEDPILYHGVTKFETTQGLTGTTAKGSSALTYTQVFGDWLCDMATADPKLVAITPAMREGSGMVTYAERFPDRYYDVAIAEQHAVTLAAGMACEGLKPVVAIYSTFLQRGYDQLVHDVALQNLDVTFAVDRAGLVGADGPTHHGAFDLSFALCIPNMIIATPSSEAECRQLLSSCYQYPGPAIVRYPRGAGTGSVPATELDTLPIGKGQVVRQGQRVAFLAFGSFLSTAQKLGDEFDATVANMRFAKPLDVELLQTIAATHDRIVTFEENAVAGGAGSEIERTLQFIGLNRPCLRIGLPDQFIEHGDMTNLYKSAGLDADSLRGRIQHFLSN
ncbi:MAG: 1-deoxy-D-xylulose 5-phosphate synthase [Fluviibacter phosphoraccumulans EoVTN8]